MVSKNSLFLFLEYLIQKHASSNNASVRHAEEILTPEVCKVSNLTFKLWPIYTECPKKLETQRPW